MKDYSVPYRKYCRYALIFLPRALRQLVFKCSRLIPSDRLYLKIVYFLTFGKWIDLDHPEKLRAFTEKIQWLKIHNDSPLHTRMADKYAAREIVEKELGPGHTFPLLGVWEHFDDIDFSKLPDQFVLKPTHDSGSIVFCYDKKTFDRRAAGKKLEAALRRNYYWFGREHPYRDIVPRLIAEPLMVEESGGALKDYKIFCFDGEVKFIQIDIDRFTNHHRNLYTPEWKLIDALTNIHYPIAYDMEIPKPELLPEMLSAAARLSKGFPCIRIDFYVVNSKLYFGEFTFHHGSGLVHILPPEFDLEMGSWIHLPIADDVRDGDK